MTRGLKNNNPGNIRLDGVHWKGEVEPSQDRAFKRFETMPWGYRAMFHLLNNYSRLHGCDTIRRMITRWAPENENDTQAYIRAVSEWSGVPADSRITTTNRDVMVPIVAAMSRMENGTEAKAADVAAGWELFMLNK